MRYECENRVLTKQDISDMKIFFDNGNSVTIREFEITDLHVFMYGGLVWYNDEICRVACKGGFTLKTDDSYIPQEYELCCNREKYDILGRTKYILGRLKNSLIAGIEATAKNHLTRFMFCGQIDNAIETNEGLRIEFLSHYIDSLGECGAKHYIELPDITKRNVGIVDLVFENCECVRLSHEEIKDIKLEYASDLFSVGWQNPVRVITGGYIHIALEDRFGRHGTIFGKGKNNAIDDIHCIESRLCGKSEKKTHDICNLYVFYGSYDNEHLVIEDIIESDRSDDYFEGGICQKLFDGSLLIAFGKSDEQTISKFIV